MISKGKYAFIGLAVLALSSCAESDSKAYDECIDDMKDSPYSNTMRDKLCKEYAKLISYGWKK